ncbi:helix-hairpin-helix domain-containing protein [Brassicibacter mesophilus]|uniref:helix-hairpin-helix domain-containing protein n=1 Tax=Brassicibacter mesophilus TaxID=745119 RepID=UPI003D1CB6EA
MRHFTKSEQIVILIFVILIVLAIGYNFYEKRDLQLIQADETNIDLDEEETIDQDFEDFNDEAEDKKMIMIHISGQVKNPGLVELFEGDRVIDAVNKAGGLTSESDNDRINLARKVSDEEKIYIPKIGEVVEQDIQNIVTFNDSNNINEKSDKININDAPKEILITLPGVGEVLADRIIEYRKNNKFADIEDIMKVSGIGSKKYEGIKDLITVN